MKAVVCELSGGADSALAAIYAKKKYPEAQFHFLFVNYGQEYAEEEEDASHDLAKKISIDFSWYLVKVNGLFETYEEPIRGLFDKDCEPLVASEYFPLRNLVISAVAASLAVKVGAEVIVNGSKSLSRVASDPFSFRDSTLPFYKLMEAAVNGGLEDGRLRIEPILAEGREQKMSKEQVYRELMAAGIQPKDTWSCYHPEVPGGECGKCRNCLEKKRILMEMSSVEH